MNNDNNKPESEHSKVNPMLQPRYSEIATFMRAPLAETLDDLDIALVGVPTDLGVTNRAGARHGPREIRNASSLGGGVVEVAPPFDPSGNTALVGASLMFDILCLVADSLSARSD